MKKHLIRFLCSAACVVFIAGCSSTSDDEPSSISLTQKDTVSAADTGLFTVNTGKYTTLDYSITPAASKNIYLVFSNPATAETASAVSLEAGSSSFTKSGVLSAAERSTPLSSQSPRLILPDLPGLISSDEPLVQQADERAIMRTPTRSAADSQNDTATFYDNSGNTIASTCRYASGSITTSQGARRLSVWVADNCWYDGGTKSYKVTQAMVDTLAQMFLNANAWASGTPQQTLLPTGTSSYDIYGLVTSVFGAEWGAHGYSNLITADGQITILLYDINNDDPTDGGVIGYFNAVNFYTTSANTNKRAMFCLDAPMFARPDSGTWYVTDYWPSAAISTLAHEFQHMIQFYQKRVLRGAGSSSTWLNEMCSLVAEDFVASYIGLSGPRGVAYNDAAAGSTGMIKGRLADMAGVPGYYLFSWPSSSDNNVYAAYGQAYALGAYLARSFGGAPFFTRIVQNAYADKNAVSCALTVSGFAETFDTVFAKWGAAMLVSDSTSAPAYYRYNSDGWFTSASGEITYSLGSINLFNYTNGYTSGPYIYSDYAGTVLSAGSQVIYGAGTLSAGQTQRWKMILPAGTILTVVAK